MSNQSGEKRDTMWVGPDLGEGVRPALRVDTDGTVHAGTLGPARPDADRVVNLKQVRGPFYEVVDEGRAVPLAGGPPKVSSDAYRRGWTRVFGNKHTVGQA